MFFWKRGAASLCPQGPLPEQPRWPPATASPTLDEPFCQHSVNTQYCIKAINSHFKETETQFSHPRQEQRLAGLRNVTAQLAAPPPWPQPQLGGGGRTKGHARLYHPSPQIRLPAGGVQLGSASSSLELEEAGEAGRHGGNTPPPPGDNDSYNNSHTERALAWCLTLG